MGRKKKDQFKLQTIGGTPSFIQKIKNNLQRQNLESQKDNFRQFLDKAGYEGAEKDDAMKKFLANLDDPSIKRKIMHEIEDKNEESKMMRAGFNIMENQQEVLDAEARKEELSKFVPDLNRGEEFAEIGGKKASNLAKNMSKIKKPLFVRKSAQEELTEEQSLGKRVDKI